MNGSDESGPKNGSEPSAHLDGHPAHEDRDAIPADALTDAAERARSGLRSDVAHFSALLSQAVVYIPLSEDLPGVEEGQEMEMGEELSFRPHMLLHEDGSGFAVAYTQPDLVQPMQQALGWQTSNDDLKFIQVPAHVALDLAQTRAEDHELAGVVFNPGTDAELVLQRDEAASLAQGKPLPLVGYVSELPEATEEGTQVLEHADPPPRALLEALNEAAKSLEALDSIDVATTFNPERDREPHLTLTFRLNRVDVNRAELADQVMERAVPHLPPPGYADIVFRGPPN